MFPFFHSWGLTALDHHDFLNAGESGLAAAPPTSSLRALGVSHALEPAQFHQMVVNLLLTYSGRDFITSTPTWRFRNLREVGSLTASHSVSQLSSYMLSPVLSFHFSGRENLLGLSILTYVLRECSVVIPHRRIIFQTQE